MSKTRSQRRRRVVTTSKTRSPRRRPVVAVPKTRSPRAHPIVALGTAAAVTLDTVVAGDGTERKPPHVHGNEYEWPRAMGHGVERWLATATAYRAPVIVVWHSSSSRSS